MLQAVDDRLPSSSREAVRQQVALALQPPYETPITVAVNGALMSSAWFFLPAALRDKLFTLHGTLAFALILAAWMYSDVPSTNVLGPDATRFVAAIDDPVMFRRLLYAKNVVLWLIITPLSRGRGSCQRADQSFAARHPLHRCGYRGSAIWLPRYLGLDRDLVPLSSDAASLSVGTSPAW